MTREREVVTEKQCIATSQGLDTDESNPASKLLLHILAAVAQFERELIRERVSAGMKATKTHGTKTGNAIGRAAPDFQSR
jgi:DNA invertase Pin-like site-specific DNA recombinase